MTVGSADPALYCRVRAEVYRLLAGLYLAPPDEGTLAALRHPDFVGEWPLGRGQDDVERGLARLTEALPSVSAETLRREFWDLFGTLGPAAAPPWQSVYLDREHTLMGEETLRVRALYARFGLAAERAVGLTDDHIGLQLQLLSELARRAADRLESGDPAGARELFSGQRACLEENLLRWVDDFAEKVEAYGETGFYAGVARLTLGVIRSDWAFLREALAEPALTRD